MTENFCGSLTQLELKKRLATTSWFVTPFLPELQHILTKIQNASITSIQNKTKIFSVDNLQAEVIKN